MVDMGLTAVLLLLQPTLPVRTESSVQPRESGKTQASAAASAAPTEGSEEVLVEHEAMGVLRSLDIDPATTAIQALENFAAKYKTGAASEGGSMVRPPPLPCPPSHTLSPWPRVRPWHQFVVLYAAVVWLGRVCPESPNR